MTIAPLSPVGSGALSPGLDPSRPGPAAKPSAADIQKASRQFEAILVRQLLAPAIDPIMNGGSLGGGEGGSGGGVYGYLLTDTLAGSISEGGGLGLANVLSRQLSAPSSLAASNDADEIE